MKTTFALFLFVGLLTPCYAAEDYEKHIKNLAAGTPKEDIKASLHALKSAGIAAFPTLIAHFGDRGPAEPIFFQREMFEHMPDGSFRPHAPTIGDACFDIIQSQIEGN